MKSFLINQWSLAILLLLAAVLIPLELFDLLKDSRGVFLLALVAAFILYQIVENIRVAESLQLIVKGKQGVSIRVFSTARDFFAAATEVVKETGHSIDACYFTPFPPTRFFDDEEIERYWRKFSELLRSRPSVSVRRLVTVDNSDKCSWITDHLREHEDCHNYNFAAIANREQLPLMNVMIIDNCRAFVFAPHGARSRNYLLIENSDFSRGMLEYYDLMWSAAVVLKDGPAMHLDRLPSPPR